MRRSIPPTLCGRKALVAGDFNQDVPTSQDETLQSVRNAMMVGRPSMKQFTARHATYSCALRQEELLHCMAHLTEVRSVKNSFSSSRMPRSISNCRHPIEVTMTSRSTCIDLTFTNVLYIVRDVMYISTYYCNDKAMTLPMCTTKYTTIGTTRGDNTVAVITYVLHNTVAIPFRMHICK